MMGLRKKTANDLQSRISELEKEIAALESEAATKSAEASESYASDSVAGDRLASEAAAISAKIAGRRDALETLRSEHRAARDAEKTEALRKRAEAVVDESLATGRAVRKDLGDFLQAWNRLAQHEASRQALDVLGPANAPATVLRLITRHSNLERPDDSLRRPWRMAPIDIDAELAAIDARLKTDKQSLVQRAMKS